MNAQERRRESRAAKQAEWKAANPLLVGVSSAKGKQALRPTLSMKRDAYEVKSLRQTQRKAIKQVTEYKNQIIRATYLYQYEFKRTPMIDGPVCLGDVALFMAGNRGKPNNPYHVIKS